ncbi:hypothetical protein PspLS_12029 [Pyricularia sp. CBS 133598]|nr:hypothetical protein PspLS_12029 [Pyricularia sp. CBS 133598]
MADVHNCKYHVRDLATRSVTLFPTQAQVIRDVKDVPLKPGTNQITIVGLSPTVDEDTIKVEGTGSAIITDITIKLLPNRDIYEDIFPDEDDDSNKDDTDSEDEKPEASAEYNDADAKLQTLQKRQETVLADEQIVKDLQDSAAIRLQFLDSWGKSLNRHHCPDIDQALQTYKQERANVALESKDASARRREIQALYEGLRLEQSRLQDIMNKERAKTFKEYNRQRKARDQKKLKKLQLDHEKEVEKERQRAERMLFWPKNCYTVLVTLEVVGVTPASSRRSSLAGDTVPVAHRKTSGELGGAMQETNCSLSLSYLTSWAYWTPSYDLAFSTASKSGTLFFDAQVTNQTSETWEDCKMMLSTSRIALAGVDGDIPELKPWGIRLAPKTKKWNDALESREEIKFRQMIGRKPIANAKSDRNRLFGEKRVSIAYAEACSVEKKEEEKEEEEEGEEKEECYNTAMFGDAARELEEEPRPSPALEFQKASFDEAGLTATYELPGQKTLAPAPTASKSRIATIAFANIVFSHTVVAKYKPVAFLQAKVLNTSKLTLLKGPVGLSLDGSFIGRVSLPRCEPGHSFVVGLGVDPAITAVYAKPEVKRGASGLLARENISVYRRRVNLFNTRATGSGTHPVTISVLDQVPVSQDERLRVDIALPRGLVPGGKGVPAGEIVVRDGLSEKGDRTWGRAVAMLKQKGEILWDVTLNPGKGVELLLEYEVACPSGEHVEQEWSGDCPTTRGLFD